MVEGDGKRWVEREVVGRGVYGEEWMAVSDWTENVKVVVERRDGNTGNGIER
jgi:hypothetical protein